MFKAWQNMNNAQDRQQRSTAGARPEPPPTPNRPRPPPRQDTKMPSEEEIRAGMNYRKPPQHPDGDRTDRGQSAWASFQQQKNQGKPGVSRSNTTKTPKKGGFDPNAPGSDERPAAGGGYTHSTHRHRSADFGRPQQQAQTGQPYPAPPPPPGPTPHSPMSTGSSPTAQRPFADPLRPFKSRTSESESPYSEGNRKRTPYSSFVGEKTHFQRDETDPLRRSASTRDTTKLDPNSPNAGRARSTSPLGRRPKSKGHSNNGAQKPFVNYSSSESNNSESRPESVSPDAPGNSPGSQRRPGTAPHSTAPFDRPKKVPTPRSHRFGGSANPFSPPSATNDGTNEPMQQKNSNNMYVNSDPLKHDVFAHSPFNAGQWATRMFGAGVGRGTDASKTAPTVDASASREADDAALPSVPRPISLPRMKSGEIPKWAYPSSVQPGGSSRATNTEAESAKLGADQSEPAPEVMPTSKHRKKKPPGLTVDTDFAQTPVYALPAYSYFRSELMSSFGELPKNLDLSVFTTLASTAAVGRKSGNASVDRIMDRVISLFHDFVRSLPPPPLDHKDNDPSFADFDEEFADQRSRSDSFTFPVSPDLFTPNGKSRSTENINTQFSPEGWNGTFKGSPDYFPPQAQASGRKASSPFRKERSGGLRSSAARNASAHANGGTAGSMAGDMPPPPPPQTNAAAGGHGEGTAPSEVKFSKEEWEKTFQEPGWAWPPPPPKPPSPSKVSAKTKGQRKASKPSGNQEQPHVVDESGMPGAQGPEIGQDRRTSAGGEHGDAMDIDDTPPASKSADTVQSENKEPRMYSVPPSQWRQQQQAQPNGHSRRPSRSGQFVEPADLKTNLDDLAHVEPMARAQNGGLKNLSDLSSTLPFQSQSSATHPTQSLKPRSLQIPPTPKAPEPPTQLNKQTWQAFAHAFGEYLRAFHTFNNTMLSHFHHREMRAQASLAGGTAWLEAMGDPAGMSAHGPIGFGSYVQGVREDETVREAWNIGCDRHEEACKSFEKVRERVRQMAVSGQLG